MNGRWRRCERWAVILIAAHSYGVGLSLLFWTAPGARLGGFGEVSPLFFPRQAGAFHLVVATAYLLDYFRHRGISLIVLAKSCAVVFLCTLTLIGGQPWVVPVSALGDALMAAAIGVLHRKAVKTSS